MDAALAIADPKKNRAAANAAFASLFSVRYVSLLACLGLAAVLVLSYFPADQNR